MTEANQEGLRAATEVSQQAMWATIRACQEKTEFVVNTILYKFEETINKRVERVLAICQYADSDQPARNEDTGRNHRVGVQNATDRS
jgi:hypothetical protein